MPVQPIEYNVYERAELQVEDVSLEEVKIAIFCLKNWKAPGTAWRWWVAQNNLQTVSANMG